MSENEDFDEEHQIDVEEIVEQIPDVEKSLQGEVVRLTAAVPHSWRGVTGCCDADRIQREVRTKLAQWAEEQKAANPKLQIFRWGCDRAQVQCRSNTGPWPDRKRSCYASVALPCWAEFIG